MCDTNDFWKEDSGSVVQEPDRRSNWGSPPITTLKPGLSRNHCGLFHPQQGPSQSTGVRCGYGWPFIFLHLPLAAKHGDCVQALLLRDARGQQAQSRSQALVQGAVAGSGRFRDERSPRQHLYEECAHLVLYRILDTAAKEGGATEEEAHQRDVATIQRIPSR
ncbi:hypothetical protein BC939DRAFT_466875 [Gamsiella multidivaricata]|uniref:uncharacterized protein n=1 Tax=Gamsiella multidivaricata TaxID=101098 RepID=UPI0022208D61|nr:uncharacterized protein BC939DRAFT_466875 [Gamsiella multidivaricata]KAI7817158.1 hypothetical protein BC939DRAFT_466875 [Gamsiella multidivaricata]